MLFIILFLYFLLNSRVKGQNEENQMGFNFRIVGGSRTRIEYQPYQVAIYLESNLKSVHCGGSIISSDWILTAGHCCYGIDKLLIKVGVTNACESRSTIESEEIITHPDYYKKYPFYADACLIKPKERLTLGQINIDKIDLEESEESVTVGETVRVTGWGARRFGGFGSCHLMGVNVRIVPKWRCDEAYGEMDTHICAGTQFGGKDSCQGDSGGPLVTLKDRKRLLGIVSFGKDCAKADFPGAYASVPKLRNWIRSVSGV